MKILFFVSGTVRSNFSYRALALARSLHERGYETAIVAPSADKYNKFVPDEKLGEIDGVKIHQPYQWKTKIMILNLIPYLFSALYRVLKERADIVYIYKPTPISIVGIAGKLFRKTTLVLDMDDLGSEVMKVEGHPWYQRALVQFSEWLAARCADKIVVASTFLYNHYQALFPRKSVYHMPNGIGSEWLVPIEAKAFDKRRIVFLGAINRKSILEPLFDVLPYLIAVRPDLEVLIMGDGSERSYFEEKVSLLGIKPYVTFIGWVSFDEAKARMMPGDIGYAYMPNERTVIAANNMKVSQYMSRGVIPMVSAIGDLPYMVDNGAVGYIAQAGNLASLKESFLAALNDADVRNRSARARLFAEQHYNWDSLAEGLDMFLRNVPASAAFTKKRVYVVTTNVPGNFGGAEIRNYHLIKQLKKMDAVDIDLFCITSSNQQIVPHEYETALGVRTHAVP
jgi:glycosyltransferase involved in cell wall biosynthesis